MPHKQRMAGFVQNNYQEKIMRIHLIAIGGAVMHNLALALQQNGHQVSGSDDEIYDPARSRLAARGLLPLSAGWFHEKITPELDLVILGMHARPGNPELERALALNVPVLSFPEYIARHAQDKTRIVVAGSHGKTTTTSMIMHLLRHAGVEFDYLVGAQLEGFDTMVRLSEAPYMVIEGDEYLSSPIDRRPKFIHYQPHILVLTGIAWDHINVFPTFEEYLLQFENLLQTLPEGAAVFYDERDPHLKKLLTRARADLEVSPYGPLPHHIENGKTWLQAGGAAGVPLQVFGEHNLANLSAAFRVAGKLGIAEGTLYEGAQLFRGAARRLQTLAENETCKAWLDFAHAPSKVAATVQAVSRLYPQRRLTACVELHTFSSLNKAFLPQYRGALQAADQAVVFYSPHTLEMKKMPPIAPEEIQEAFGHPNLRVFTTAADLEHFLRKNNWQGRNLLLMSSGTFGGLDTNSIAEALLNNAA